MSKIKRSLIGAFFSRTIWLSVATIVTGALIQYSDYVKDLFDDPKRFSMFMIGIGVAFAILRSDTVTSLADKRPRYRNKVTEDPTNITPEQ